MTPVSIFERLYTPLVMPLLPDGGFDKPALAEHIGQLTARGVYDVISGGSIRGNFAQTVDERLAVAAFTQSPLKRRLPRGVETGMGQTFGYTSSQSANICDYPHIQMSCEIADQALDFFAWGAWPWACTGSHFLPKEHLVLYRACAAQGVFAIGSWMMAATMPPSAPLNDAEIQELAGVTMTPKSQVATAQSGG